MAIVLRWFRAFRWSYWRRCKGCNVRGSKCLCRRPSLAMEQIFFMEERKNKFGARNFSHVSDSAVTGSSGSGSGSGTVLSSGTSFGEDYRAGDFYRSTQEPISTALVRKHSGTMVPMSGGRSYSQDDVNYSGSYEYNSYQENARTSNLRQRSARRQLPPSSSVSSENEYSIQVYNRKQQPRVARSTSRSSSRMSSGDSIVIRPSNASSIRVSTASDRMSIDGNTGSYNPRNRFLEGSYAPSIQEDEDDVQARLNGLLMLPSPASSTSTILERPRYPQYY